jgi:hypothetical protein
MEWVLAGCFGLGGVMVAQSAWDWLGDFLKRYDKG